MSETLRLAKQLAIHLGCSRREAEIYIEGGWVTVDGKLIEEPGFRVEAGQKLELLPGASLQETEPVTILLHKPAGLSSVPGEYGISPSMALINADNLAPDDRSGLRFLRKHLTGLKAVDTLETMAAGLQVFTQDWHVARKLVDDAGKTEYEYIVEVSGSLPAEGLALLNHGLSFNGKALPPIKVSWQNETRLRFALKTPPLGLIQHMCEKVGLKVVAMRRIRIGRVPMAALAAGQWRYLLGYEKF
ncbi:rRNA pseudouridine synthase [Undibacterium sp.]|jgi:23S rRNA pseudouridine2604 synthase|uniref:rRNA pseudouridine synthase n=1 Tax=Undibacterium sp. TaxID=1914977 RepID=UPI002BF26209|nr:rRNA pseudouridine synthase [Undibacterium sp.]HTD05314.1 rRNA pseudouridine synthase [Undibacterium sp.]